MISTYVSGDDFDEAAALFSADYDLPTFVGVPSEKKFFWSARSTGDERMTLRSNRFLANMDTTYGLDEEFVVEWARGGETVLESASTTLEFPLGLPIMLPDSRSTMRLRGTDLDMSVVQIDAAYLRGIADEMDDVAFLDFHAAPPISAHALNAWRRTIDLVADVALDPAVPVNSLLRAEMSRLVAIAMLTTFPFRSVARARGIRGNEPDSVRAAIEYARQNAHLPIGPADLAAAVGLSARSLQAAIRRHRETTPSALIQAVRLERVRAELQAAESNASSVTDIARAWGFTHLGRFAGSYRKLFGESPSETLRSRPHRR